MTNNATAAMDRTPAQTLLLRLLTRLVASEAEWWGPYGEYGNYTVDLFHSHISVKDEGLDLTLRTAAEVLKEWAAAWNPANADPDDETAQETHAVAEIARLATIDELTVWFRDTAV